MKYFSKLDANNIVVDCLGVNDSDAPDEATGQTFLRNLTNDSSSIWKETSRENSGNGFRGNMGGIGCTYMTGVRTLGVGSTDVFMQQQPYASWTVGVGTAQWYPPDNPGIAPALSNSDKTAGKYYVWNESNYQSNPATAWVLTTP